MSVEMPTDGEFLHRLRRSSSAFADGQRARRLVTGKLDETAMRALEQLAAEADAVPAAALAAVVAVLFFRYTGTPTLSVEVEDHDAVRVAVADFVLALAPDDTPRDIVKRCCGRTPLRVDDAASSSARPHPDLRVLYRGGPRLVDDVAAEAGIVISFLHSDASLSVAMSYCVGDVADGLARRIPRHLRALMESFVARPNGPISWLRYLPLDELAYVIRALSAGPRRAYPRMTPAALFDGWALREPASVAVVARGGAMSYGELRARSLSISHFLLAHGVRRGVRVGVLLERSAEWVAAILGILRAGAVYVPLSSANPLPRNRYICASGGVKHLITDSPSAAADYGDLVALQDVSQIAPPATDVPCLPEIAMDDDAYLIFTSGSTGVPKGARISHAALTNYVFGALETFDTAGSRPIGLQFSEPSFDASIGEVFYSLCHGGTLVIQQKAALASIAEYVTTIERDRPSIISPPTTFWHEWRDLIDRDKSHVPDCVRTIAIGGENADPLKFATRGLPSGMRLFNCYGPTEATVVSTAYPCSDESGESLVRIPIGRPLPNVEVYVLDDDLAPVAAEVVGEICVTGEGLSSGYVNLADANARSFVQIAIPELDCRRDVYRTGDLGYFREDGNIVFVGRRDDQIKIQGIRVELQEIEVHLNAHPLVKRGVVVSRPRPRKEPVVTAFLEVRWEAVARPAEAISRIDAELRARLPSYMIPRRYRIVDTFPLNASGKIDRRRLAENEPDDVATALRSDTHPIERALLEMWNAQNRDASLSSPEVDLRELGVNSLRLSLFFVEAMLRFGVSGSQDVLADVRTLHDLAEALRSHEAKGRVATEPDNSAQASGSEAK